LTGVKLPPIRCPLGFAQDFRHNCVMVLSRRLKRALAWLLAACLMFAQTAAVAYACSRGEAAAAAVAATPCSAHLAAEGTASVQGDGQLAQGNVCEVHCQTASLPDSGAFDLPSVVAVARWEIPPRDVMAGVPGPTPELEARSAAPPLLALFPRLLI
jgi:hypothetical protein